MKHGSELLKAWIGKMKFQQQDAAEYFGWHETFISKLVKGHRNPGLTNALIIERKTGIPVESWLTKSDSDLPESTHAVVVGGRKRK